MRAVKLWLARRDRGDRVSWLCFERSDSNPKKPQLDSFGGMLDLTDRDSLVTALRRELDEEVTLPGAWQLHVDAALHRHPLGQHTLELLQHSRSTLHVLTLWVVFLPEKIADQWVHCSLLDQRGAQGSAPYAEARRGTLGWRRSDRVVGNLRQFRTFRKLGDLIEQRASVRGVLAARSPSPADPTACSTLESRGGAGMSHREFNRRWKAMHGNIAPRPYPRWDVAAGMERHVYDIATAFTQGTLECGAHRRYGTCPMLRVHPTCGVRRDVRGRVVRIKTRFHINGLRPVTAGPQRLNNGMLFGLHCAVNNHNNLPTRTRMAPWNLLLNMQLRRPGGLVLSHREFNKLWHIAHGNTTSLVTKIYTDGIPKLKSADMDTNTFIMWQLELRAWCKLHSLTPFVVGPMSDDITEAQVAQGKRYLAAAIEDSALASAAISGAAGIDDGDLAEGGAIPATAVGGSAPAALRWLNTEYLQGVAEQPAIANLLDSVALKPDENIITFKAKFCKLADALDPAHSDHVLCTKFMAAITKKTGQAFEACITAATAAHSTDDFATFAQALCRLCMGAMARARDNARENSQVTALNAQVKLLTDQVEALAANSRPPGPPGREGRKRLCPNCGKEHAGKCREPPAKCDFVLPDGRTCGGSHLRRFCFYCNMRILTDARTRG